MGSLIFRRARGLTTRPPYDTLAKLTTPQHISKHLKGIKLLQRHSEDTPQQLQSNSEDKKQFYIYYTISNLIFNIKLYQLILNPSLSS